MQRQNPMMMIQQLSQYMSSYNGKNPEAEARQMIANANLDQRQLNALQGMANNLYNAAQKMGIIK